MGVKELEILWKASQLSDIEKQEVLDIYQKINQLSMKQKIFFNNMAHTVKR